MYNGGRQTNKGIQQIHNCTNGLTRICWIHICTKKKGRTQCRELPLCAGSREGCQWQVLPSPVQCEETTTRTRDLPVIGSKTLPLAPGPPFERCMCSTSSTPVVHTQALKQKQKVHVLQLSIGPQDQNRWHVCSLTN